MRNVTADDPLENKENITMANGFAFSLSSRSYLRSETEMR